MGKNPYEGLRNKLWRIPPIEYYAAVFYKAVFQCTYMESSLSYKFKKIKDTKQ